MIVFAKLTSGSGSDCKAIGTVVVRPAWAIVLSLVIGTFFLTRRLPGEFLQIVHLTY